MLSYVGGMWTYLSIHGFHKEVQVIWLLCNDGCEFHLDISRTDSSMKGNTQCKKRVDAGKYGGRRSKTTHKQL